MPPTRPQRAKSPEAAPTGPSRRAPRVDRHCRALHEDGSDCRARLLHASHVFCPAHHREYKRLYESYKRTEKHYSGIESKADGADDVKTTIKAKVAAGRETLRLRDQVNRRFFSFSVQNRGHVKWIMKLQSEVLALERELERELAAPEAPEAKGSASPRRPPKPQSLSPLDPAVPLSALGHLPVSSPIVVLRQASDAILTAKIKELYSISPALDDSSSLVLDDVDPGVTRELDDRDYIIRFFFRELIAQKADADVLARAARTQSINTFLRESSAEHVEGYIRFFHAFQEGRHHTLHILRDAVCDYLLIDSKSPSTTILGAGIATDDSPRRMTSRGWDLLWTNFHDIVGWWNLELFAVQFDDLVAVKALTACQRYGTGTPSEDDEDDKDNEDNRDDVSSWYVPNEDVSQESALAVLHGFIAVTKGFSDHDSPRVEAEPAFAKERQTRCYLVGRMSKQDPVARQLAQELAERIASFVVLVYDREKEGEAASALVLPAPPDANPWIGRSRTAPTNEALGSQPWTVEWSLADVLSDIGLIHSLRDRNMAKDYYEFIIIDRTPGKTFDILDAVADALSKLKGDSPFDQVFRQVIAKYVPAEERDQYLEAVAQMDFGQPTLSAPPQYLGNRVRSWDIPNSLRAILGAALQDSSRVTTLHESRLISHVAADLESHGVTARITEYEASHTCPIAVRGVDGLDDLYFHYDMGPMSERVIRGSVLDFDPSINSLTEFAEAYHRAHPNAVFAKGSIKVHYCAWPMPMLAGPRYSRLNFRTPEGRLYRWKALPFDIPLASRVWQVFVNHELNSRLPFARLQQTTLLICAENRDDAESSAKALSEIGEKHGWSFSIPPPASWLSDVKGLGLETLWEGVRAAL
ncbi:hypothetical protein MYCTH_2309563 [Thermothelomyces thermophilus ATCC 42464]|uniref:Uncharacterized protein n=1 Tax=Thermothelomyces thermophilus (strain ATCC 42464 / BCRC 31852 / DSM 1799) TaxID=573729 RepID=G2QIQ6_THET4|nr:uncharacterized protein MYCTH_2309563 [Thermothelomyces thermophilus ATCC 42464]AEO60378.1 hypothetical protein MYCTH_2309563 [Thermothelomyces thermophilus ATCC 42464]